MKEDRSDSGWIQFQLAPCCSLYYHVKIQLKACQIFPLTSVAIPKCLGRPVPVHEAEKEFYTVY